VATNNTTFNFTKLLAFRPMVWRHNRVSRGFLSYARELKCQDICPGERAVVFASCESTKEMLWKRPKASYMASPWCVVRQTRKMFVQRRKAEPVLREDGCLPHVRRAQLRHALKRGNSILLLASSGVGPTYHWGT